MFICVLNYYHISLSRHFKYTDDEKNDDLVDVSDADYDDYGMVKRLLGS